jgi:hypothetical protein
MAHGMLIRRMILLGLLAATVAPAQTTRPSPIAIEAVRRREPDQRIMVARIDLTDPRVHFCVAAAGPDPNGDGPWETVLRPTSQIAAEHGLDLAINTVFFSHKTDEAHSKIYMPGEWARSENLLVSGGKVLTPTRGGASLVIETGNRAWIGTVGKIPEAAHTIVTGNAQILARGRDLTSPDDKVGHPRTAAGLTADGKTLVLLTVDGRREGWSTGMTMRQLAAEMLVQGCTDAINLDGGGSTTMVARQPDGKQKVLNLPSDGSTMPLPLSIERPVPYVLGVTISEPAVTK